MTLVDSRTDANGGAALTLRTSNTPIVELVIPCLNEAHVLEKSVTKVRTYLAERFPYRWRILIADNGSTDGTIEVAEALAARFPDVECLRIPARGRGRALRLAWTKSAADIMAYTDVDISTDLSALEPICRAIWEDGYGVATGSRLMRESKTTRGPKREFISRCYNLIVKCVLFTRFSDAQCGFKAVSRRVAEEVVPHVRDNSWFFDTELLFLCEKLGYRVKDVPATWIDDDDSRVKIVSTAVDDLKGVARLAGMCLSGALRRRRGELAAARAKAAGEARTGSTGAAEGRVVA